MSTHKHIDRVCIAAAVFSLLLAMLFVNGEALGIRPASAAQGYEARLFDNTRVHTIQIVMNDWDSFLETCENEEYAACSVVIDNEAYKNVGIRAKGNTSLSMVSAMDSSRYSFKLEFDHYETGKSYYGLDKLCLNNLIQDNTCMKDYLVYQMMDAYGVNAPLCSYVYITVNGEDWGLYLAVEGVEDGFLQRNYGAQYGSLYKPDSLDLGGGPGNGRDFNMDGVDLEGFNPEAFNPEEFNRESFQPKGPDAENGQQPSFDAPPDGMPDGEAPSGQPGEPPDGEASGERPGGTHQDGRGGPGGMGGMGSSDVKLQYTDDDPESYANIFGNAKTEVTNASQARLIHALKTLAENGAEAVDTDQVLRYFAVHNFVCNGDSYTGSMVHNYYLYEKDGKLSMIPWDYNLAFGTFQARDASSAVNDPIDTPLSVTGSGDRPMIDWIFQSDEAVQLYHQYFAGFLETVDWAAIIDKAYPLIAPYVEKDPTKFCTYEEFEAGVEALRTFCQLRQESVSGQLDGTIPSTSEGQAADSAALVDASALTLSDMGTMNQGGGFGGGRPGQRDSGGTSGEEGSGGGTEPAQTGGTPVRLGREGAPAGDFPGGPGSSEGLDSRTYPLLAASMAVLAAGLLTASRYKRRGR